MPVDTTKLPEIIKAIEKTYKGNPMHTGNDFERVPRIPFPSLELNIATGGGVPLGRISRFFGAYSSAKTLTSLNLIAASQNLNLLAEQYLESESELVRKRGERLLEMFPEGLTVAYYNAEGVFDADFAEKVGVDTEKLIVVDGSRLEQIGSIIEASLGAVHVHIVDSASACVSIDELNSKIEDWHRGIKSRAWGKVLDHVQDKIDNYENSIVLIDQVRTEQMTGAEMAPGGNKLEHASSLTVHFKRGKWLYNRDGILKAEAPQKGDTISGSPEADGFQIKAVVRKSRVGRPLRKAEMQLDFSTMKFDKLFEYAKAAEYFDVVTRGGAWYELPDGNKVQGINGLRGAIEEDEQLQKKILDKVEEHVALNP